jgi:hypothetical protein
MKAKGGPLQRISLFPRSDRDAQIFFYFREIEPAHEDFPRPQFLLPLVRCKSRRLGEDKICLARKHAEAHFGQFARQPFARGDDALEIRTVEFQIAERRGGGGLAEAVDVVAVAYFVQRRDEVVMAYKITDTLEAQ